MSVSSHADKWWSEANSMPQITELMPNSRGIREWSHVVEATGFDDVLLDDRPVPCTVRMQRLSNDEPQYDSPQLEYEVAIWLEEPGNPQHMISMTPAAAIKLGQCLLLAGAAAQRDLAINTGAVARRQAGAPKAVKG